MSLIRQVVLDAFLPFTERFEGLTTWFYLDIKRLVTIGYGNLMDPVGLLLAAGLVFEHPDGSRATNSEVYAAWSLVKNDRTLDPLDGGGQYAKLTGIRATRECLAPFEMGKLNAMSRVLETFFPRFRFAPAPAQLAALSKEWAGGGGFPKEWPLYGAAFVNEKWGECAIQTRPSPAQWARQNDSYHRRIETEVLLLEAAARVAEAGGDPDELVIPDVTASV